MFFVLKHNDSFAVLDPAGNILCRNKKEHDVADGLITRDTRMLSRYMLSVGKESPVLVESFLEKSNVVFHARLVQEAIEIERTSFVWKEHLYERLDLRNTSGAPVETKVEYTLEADFVDLFELHGAKRPARGLALPLQKSADSVTFSYTGLDHALRATTIAFSENFSGANPASFTFTIAPQTVQTLYIRAGSSATTLTGKEYDAMRAACTGFIDDHLSRRPQFSSSNPVFDKWIHANAVDIALLTTETADGLYPYAGIPWYSCPFGRDGIITAFELLWQDPAVAKGVLTLLAKHQATAASAFHDSAPGKIMHEIRNGEMAALKEIPHTPYYGTADATPLFISLAGAYFERTGDKAFITALWPHIVRALEWIDLHGDRDGDGYVEYLRGAESGLGNQGWKDSQDAISHANGDLASGAIALCEVQGYVYDAKRAAAAIAQELGKPEDAEKLAQAAEDLKNKFNADFWSEDLGTYALALDGDKKPCLVSASNPGHLLFSGIATPERAQKTAEKLMSPDMFSGWGIRTLSGTEKRYEPMKPPEGYHNGTVWVHDTALCAAGFARYGMEDKAATLLTALFEAAQHFPGLRLPELFAGLPRNGNEAPARYPVACSPQAWASASESMLLQSMLGIRVDGREKTIIIENPRLPNWLHELKVSNLSINGARISLQFKRKDEATVVEVIEKSPYITCRLPEK